MSNASYQPVTRFSLSHMHLHHDDGYPMIPLAHNPIYELTKMLQQKCSATWVAHMTLANAAAAEIS